MNREVHVRFWESLGVRFPWATQLVSRRCDLCSYGLDSGGARVRRQVLREREVRSRGAPMRPIAALAWP